MSVTDDSVGDGFDIDDRFEFISSKPGRFRSDGGQQLKMSPTIL